MSAFYVGIPKLYTAGDFFDDAITVMRLLGAQITSRTSAKGISLSSYFASAQGELVYVDGSNFSKRVAGRDRFTNDARENVTNHIEYFLAGLTFSGQAQEPVRLFIRKTTEGFVRLDESGELRDMVKMTTSVTRRNMEALASMAAEQEFLDLHLKEVFTAVLQSGMVYFLYNGIAPNCRSFEAVSAEWGSYQEAKYGAGRTVSASLLSAMTLLRHKALEQIGRNLPAQFETALSPAASVRLSGEQADVPCRDLKEAFMLCTDGFRRHVSIHLIGPAGAGKTTQLVQLGKDLMADDSAPSPGRCIFLYMRAAALSPADGEDLLHAVLRQPVFDAPDALEQALRNRAGDLRLVAAIDGLDEVSAEKRTRIFQGIRAVRDLDRLFVVAASRSTEMGLFDGDSASITLRQLEPDSEQVQSFLIRHHLQSAFFRADMPCTPMLLQLSARRQQIARNYPAEALSELAWIPETPGGSTGMGEVIWNNLQIELFHAARKGAFDFTRQLLFEALPRVVYHQYLKQQRDSLPRHTFENCLIRCLDPQGGSRKELGRNAIRALTGMGLIQQISDRIPEIRLHGLYRDFFGMIHAANILWELFSGMTALSEEQEAVLADPMVFDDAEKNGLMVSILPGIMLESDVNDPGFMQKTTELLRLSAPGGAGTKADACRLFYSAMYPLWCVRSLSDRNADASCLHDLTRDAHRALEALGRELLAGSRLLPPVCIAHVLGILTKVARSGCLFLQTASKPKVDAFWDGGTLRPNLHLCKTYALAAAKLQEQVQPDRDGRDTRLADGFNHLGKAYLAAWDDLRSWLLMNPGKPRLLGPEDLLLCAEDFAPLGLTAEEIRALSEQFAVVGTELAHPAAVTRAGLLHRLAVHWLNRAKDSGSVLSANLLALMEETVQEQKPKAQRDYLPAFTLLYRAAGTPHPTGRTYAIYKCIQYLAEGKAALDGNGVPCRPGPETDSASLAIAAAMLKNAPVQAGVLGKYHYCAALLAWGMPDRDPRTVCEHLRLALMHHGSVPVCLSVFRIVLAIGDPAFRDLFLGASARFLDPDSNLGFHAYAASVPGKRSSDQDKPTWPVFLECCELVISLASTRRETIARMTLTGQLHRLISCVEREKVFVEPAPSEIDTIP